MTVSRRTILGFALLPLACDPGKPHEGFLGLRHPPFHAAARFPPAGPALPDLADQPQPAGDGTRGPVVKQDRPALQIRRHDVRVRVGNVARGIGHGDRRARGDGCRARHHTHERKALVTDDIRIAHYDAWPHAMLFVADCGSSSTTTTAPRPTVTRGLPPNPRRRSSERACRRCC